MRVKSEKRRNAAARYGKEQNAQRTTLNALSTLPGIDGIQHSAFSVKHLAF